jgi:hypothetical protein
MDRLVINAQPNGYVQTWPSFRCQHCNLVAAVEKQGEYVAHDCRQFPRVIGGQPTILTFGY